MTLHDDNQEAARIIKQLEQRISNLEEGGRKGSTPNPLVTVNEQPNLGDEVESVTERSMGELRWNNDSAGWKTGMWGSYGRN